MADFNKIDQVTINGNNYDRTRSTIEISGLGKTTDISLVVKGITYSETPDIQFDYSLGSRRPTAVGFGNITSEGTLTLTDAGLEVLQSLAKSAGLPSLLYAGQVGQVDITCTYVTYNGKTKTDKLQHIYFTNNNNGVNTDDVLYSRELSMIIGRIDNGTIA